MNPNRAIGFVSALLAALVIFVLIPSQTESVGFGALEPAGFPTFAAIIVLIFGLIQTIWPTGQAHLDKHELIRAALAIVITVFALWLMIAITYTVGAPLLVALIMLLMGERRLWLLALTVVGGPLLLWGLFEVMLHRPLP